MTGTYAGGENGFLGGALAWKPGDVTDPNAFVAPTQFYMAAPTTLDEAIDHKSHDVMAGPSPDIDQSHRSGKATSSGNFTAGLYPNNMYEIIVGGIGTDQLVTALAADTAVSITTPAGITTFVLTTGGAYAFGDWITFEVAGATQEARIVLTYNSGTKTGTCGALKYAHPGSGSGAGVPIVKGLQHKARPYTEADGTGFSRLLRRFSIEESEGGNYSWRYLNTQVGKLDIKGSASNFEVAYDLNSSTDRVLANGQGANPAASTFAKDSSWNDLAFEFVDGFLTFPTDPTDSGTATLQKSVDAMDWGVTIDNGFKAEDLFDEQRAKKFFRHARKVTVTWKMLNSASRPVGWTDFLSKDLNVPFVAQMYYKDASGAIVAMAVCCPNLRYTNSKPIKGLNTVIGEEITAEAIAVGSSAKVFLQTINNFVAAV